MGSFTKFIFMVLSLQLTILAISVDKELTLTKTQKQKLDKFKGIMLPKLTRDYQRQDIFLLRCLRAKNFDVNKSVEFLNNHLRWMKEYKIESVHSEDWSDFQRDYPYYTDGVDRGGRPIYALPLGLWDVRKAALAGKMTRLCRWLNKGRDEAMVKVRELQKQGKTNITQFNFLLNLDKFSATEHLCIQCMPMYTDFANLYENHYFGTADKIILFNSPQIFEIVLNLVRPILSQGTRDALQVYGKNKAEWDKVVFADIDRDQLPGEWGGTRVYNNNNIL